MTPRSPGVVVQFPGSGFAASGSLTSVQPIGCSRVRVAGATRVATAGDCSHVTRTARATRTSTWDSHQHVGLGLRGMSWGLTGVGLVACRPWP